MYTPINIQLIIFLLGSKPGPAFEKVNSIPDEVLRYSILCCSNFNVITVIQLVLNKIAKTTVQLN